VNRMLSRSLTAALLGATLLVAAPASAAPASAKQVKKTLKTLITAIRYAKYDLAAKQLDVGEMVERLMADSWKKLSDADKQEMTTDFEKILRLTSFVKGHEMFEHLDAVLYDEPRDEDGTAKCKSTIVVHRNYKKTEIVIDWVLHQEGGSPRIYDIVMLGESTLDGIREDQVEPLLEDGGTAAVMKALRDKLKELESH